MKRILIGGILFVLLVASIMPALSQGTSGAHLDSVDIGWE